MSEKRKEIKKEAGEKDTRFNEYFETNPNNLGYNAYNYNGHRFVLWKTVDDYQLTLYHSSISLSINFKEYRKEIETGFIYFYEEKESGEVVGDLRIESGFEWELMEKLLDSYNTYSRWNKLPNHDCSECPDADENCIMITGQDDKNE